VHTAVLENTPCTTTTVWSRSASAGSEATCAVLADFVISDLYVLPPVEIVPPQRSKPSSTKTAKYSGKTAEICPGRFSTKKRRRLPPWQRPYTRILGLSQYSRTDCIVRDGEVYFLEVNTLPGLTSESLFPKLLMQWVVTLMSFSGSSGPYRSCILEILWRDPSQKVAPKRHRHSPSPRHVYQAGESLGEALGARRQIRSSLTGFFDFDTLPGRLHVRDAVSLSMRK
jgi:hypothetical protein